MSDSNEGTFSIRVVNERGNPVRGAKVSCQYGRMSGVGSEYTDSNGWAEFPIISGAIIDRSTITIMKVWVNGEEVSDGSFTPEDGDTFSFVISR